MAIILPFACLFVSAIGSPIVLKTRDVSVSMWPENRIVGGEDAASGVWKWQGSLQWSSNPAETAFRHICGASLLDETTVLTAAHCVEFDNDVTHFRVVLGEHKLSTPSGDEQEMPVQNIIIHESYGTTPVSDDIAVLRLAASVQLNSNVQPISLPRDLSEDFIRSKCWITGWGRLNHTDNVLPDVLQEVQVKTFTHEDCRCRHLGLFLYLLESMICVTGRKSPATACNGDSGGPLVCKDEGKWVLAGVTSFGITGCPTDIPVVYTRVTSFRDWVMGHMS